MSSDLPSVKFNRQYRRNRATSPFDLHTVERLLAGRYEDSGDGSVSTQQDSLPRPGAKERKEQRRQRQPVVEQLPLHNSTETPRKMHLPHTVAINDLNSNAVPSGTAEVYQQVLSAQVAIQQVSVPMAWTWCVGLHSVMLRHAFRCLCRHKRGCFLRLPR